MSAPRVRRATVLLAMLVGIGACTRFGFSIDGTETDQTHTPQLDTTGQPGDSALTPRDGQAAGGDGSTSDDLSSIPSDGSSPDATTIDDGAQKVDAPADAVTANDGAALQVDGLQLQDAAPPAVSAGCLASGWCWEAPLPQGYTLGDAWIVSPDLAFAVGEKGTVLRYQAGSWSLEPQLTDRDLHGVWALAQNEAIAVGNDGVVLTLTSGGWQQATIAPGVHWMDVWGSSPSDVYAVGARIYHFDGTSWSEEPSVPAGSYYGVWGVSGHVFAVGGSGLIARKVGSGPWTTMASNVTRPLSGVWGTDPSNVWAVGTVGNITYYDGVAWTPKSINGGWLGTVWGRSATEVYFSGAGSMFYDGANYNTWGAPISMIAMGDDSGILIGVSSPGRIVRYDGTNWEVPATLGGQVSALWGSAETDLYAFGPVSRRYDGTTWQDLQVGAGETVTTAWGVSSSEIYLGGTNGYLARFDGTAFQQIATGTTNGVKAVWAASTSNIVIATEGTSSETVARYNGTGWQSLISNSPRSAYPNAVWGEGSTVYVGLNSSSIQVFDGATPTITNTSTPIRALWGTSATNVFAVGDSGTILHYSGTGWQPQPSGTANNLLVLYGTSPTEIYAVGDAGTIRRYNGTFWQALPDGPSYPIHGVWAGGTRLWIAQQQGYMLSRPR